MAGIKNDAWIRQMSKEKGMIEPFEDRQVRKGVISFGLSSYGYDIRIADEFRIPEKTMAGGDGGEAAVLDPKDQQAMRYTDVKGDIVIAPHSFVLGRSLEYFRIPRKVLTICQGKSTYARVGVMVNVTPFEPEWEGHATMCIVNTSNIPVRVHANEGIAQLIFFEGDEPPEVSYADKKGKYQASVGIIHSKVEKGG
jgi:dCTP deaminase